MVKMTDGPPAAEPAKFSERVPKDLKQRALDQGLSEDDLGGFRSHEALEAFLNRRDDAAVRRAAEEKPESDQGETPDSEEPVKPAPREAASPKVPDETPPPEDGEENPDSYLDPILREHFTKQDERLRRLEAENAAAKKRAKQLLVGVGLAAGLALLVGFCALRGANRKPLPPPAAPKMVQAPPTPTPKATPAQEQQKQEDAENLDEYLDPALLKYLKKQDARTEKLEREAEALRAKIAALRGVAAAINAVPASAVESFAGEVVGVTDGDTISVMHAGRAEKIRLNGVDCPEMGQAFGNNAKQFVSEQCFGKQVTIKATGKDRYGRTLGDVMLPDGKALNQELVRAGLAWWYQQYSQDQTLAALEKEAKGAKRGLWTDTNAIPPWEFRHPQAVQSVPSPISAEPPRPSVPSISTAAAQADTAAAAAKAIEAARTAARAAAAQAEADRRAAAYAAAQRAAAARAEAERQAAARAVQGVTVYVTRTGAKYHRAGCRYLSKSMIPMPLEEAKKRYGPCSVCNPPR